MKAVVCKEHGLPDKLSLETAWPDPEMGDDDVLIDVKAAGLNFPDVLIIQNKYQTKPDLPFIPGGECSGVVVAVGKNVTRLQPGEKVISMGAHGAFCSRIAANQHAVFPMPDGLTFEQAAGVTTAVELGKLMGARVIAAASTEEKLTLCKQLGADELINYSDASLKDTLKELTGGKGVDVVYDPVGGDYSEPALRSMAWNGRYLVIGFASGPIPSIPLNLALLKGCSIVGVFWGRFMAEEPAVNLQNIHDLWALFAEGKLKPVVTDLFALEDYEAAYACMMERRARGKVILTL